MKKIIFSGISFVLFLGGYSQSLERAVIGSAGGVSTSGNLSISFTSGESMVKTLSAGGFTLTQGFQQSTKTGGGSGTSINDLNTTDIRVYPNPFNEVFTLKISPDLKAEYQILNVLGQKIEPIMRIYDQLIQFDLSEYQGGIYFLKIYAHDATLTTIKLQKN